MIFGYGIVVAAAAAAASLFPSCVRVRFGRNTKKNSDWSGIRKGKKEFQRNCVEESSFVFVTPEMFKKFACESLIMYNNALWTSLSAARKKNSKNTQLLRFTALTPFVPSTSRRFLHHVIILCVRLSSWLVTNDLLQSTLCVACRKFWFRFKLADEWHIFCHANATQWLA